MQGKQRIAAVGRCDCTHPILGKNSGVFAIEAQLPNGLYRIFTHRDDLGMSGQILVSATVCADARIQITQTECITIQIVSYIKHFIIILVRSINCRDTRSFSHAQSRYNGQHTLESDQRSYSTQVQVRLSSMQGKLDA